MRKFTPSRTPAQFYRFAVDYCQPHLDFHPVGKVTAIDTSRIPCHDVPNVRSIANLDGPTPMSSPTVVFEMEPAAGTIEHRETTLQSPLSWWSALVLAAWFGLVGGYIDLGMIVLKTDLAHAALYHFQGRNFLWVVPVANLVIMMVTGLLVAGVNRLRPGLVSLRSAAFLFATLVIWEPLLRAPLYLAASLVFAAGAARLISRRVAYHASGFGRFARYSLIVLVALVGTTAVVSLRRQALAESGAMARLPVPPAGAGNVLLIVMDTVRADSLGLYGYIRDTTPHLERWAKKGVRFDWALAPAPWTFPSHCSFLTGQWSLTLNAHWDKILSPDYPTLAEFLAARGYLTGGFIANTYWCSYESGMDRGFAHYEDFPLTLQTVLGSAVLGRWIVENLRNPRDYSSVKWIQTQSQDAAGINRSFLDWLSRERSGGRPFFAFLNYFDAHVPFLLPEDEAVRFGLRPKSRSEYKMLMEYSNQDKLTISERDVELARDSYDNCIAALDRQVGSLLDELERRGVLRDTLVIITSDHGEQFGEHRVFNHGISLYAYEVHVPLLIISPAAPPGRTVSEPVSLRDLPATVVALSGLGAGSTFAGRSLAEYWQSTPGAGASHTVRTLSEVDIPTVILPEYGPGPNQRGFTVSLVAEGLHYLLDIRGTEELYDLAADPRERHNLRNDPGRNPALGRFRNSLDEVLRETPVTSAVAAAYRNHLITVLEALRRPPPIRRPAPRRRSLPPLGSRSIAPPVPTALRSGGRDQKWSS
jgi:arylsulfatase A-like enzyme